VPSLTAPCATVHTRDESWCSSSSSLARRGYCACQAAAYLFHVVSNHPFVDGNKRAGLLAAQVFLPLNGVVILHGSEALYALTMGMAEGRIDKATASTSQRLRR